MKKFKEYLVRYKDGDVIKNTSIFIKDAPDYSALEEAADRKLKKMYKSIANLELLSIDPK